MLKAQQSGAFGSWWYRFVHGFEQPSDLESWLSAMRPAFSDAGFRQIETQVRAQYQADVERRQFEGAALEEARTAALATLGEPIQARQRFLPDHLSPQEASKLANGGEPTLTTYWVLALSTILTFVFGTVDLNTLFWLTIALGKLARIGCWWLVWKRQDVRGATINADKVSLIFYGLSACIFSIGFFSRLAMPKDLLLGVVGTLCLFHIINTEVRTRMASWRKIERGAV